MGKASFADRGPHREAAAVFVKLEGTLFHGGVLSQAAYVAANAPRFSDRIFKLSQVALSLPVSWVVGRDDLDFTHRWTYLSLKGLSRDRIEVLAEEYCDKILRRQVIPAALDFILQHGEAGRPLVLVSAGLDVFLRPLLELLRLEGTLYSNQLEYKDGVATGRLHDPVIGGHSGWRRILAAEEEKGVKLARAFAYGSGSADFLLLNAVGNPCAVNPDLRLNRAARDLNWPVMEF